MNVRTYVLAGLVATIAAPAAAHASSSGLTRSDRERGQVVLLSERGAQPVKKESRVARAEVGPQVDRAQRVRQHGKAMQEGRMRMPSSMDPEKL